MPIKENMDKWKATPCSMIIRINIKMSMLHKGIHKISSIYVRIPMSFSHRNGEKNL